MPNAFNFSVSPFDALTPAQQQLVQGSVDIAYYPEGTVILEVGAHKFEIPILVVKK